MYKKNIIILAFLLLFLALSGIEIGGYITEDTVWYPQHNPYVITSFLYIDSNVTLTILLGTHVLSKEFV